MTKEDIEIAAAHYEDELHSWHHKTHRDSFEDGAFWAMEEIYKQLSESTFSQHS